MNVEQIKALIKESIMDSLEVTLSRHSGSDLIEVKIFWDGECISSDYTHVAD